MFQKKLLVFVIALVLVALGRAGYEVEAAERQGTDLVSRLATTVQQTTTSYPVVDTGQVLCYDASGAEIACPGQGAAFYGQDAQTDGRQPSYADNGDGTITDNNTGLMWQQAVSEKMTCDEAVAAADGFGLLATTMGYDDWRLPNAKELHSIVDYTRAPAATGSAAIDPVFSVTPITDEDGDINYPFYWTGNTHANWTASPGAWGVYVAFGEALGWMQPPGGGAYLLVDVHGAGAQRSEPKAGDPAD
ncbi:MAG: DUF1566 domain-containing protein [Anaerolineae bacterium]|nr:DUF1566 domain-containing protein [Anaerolineae bacterium]